MRCGTLGVIVIAVLGAATGCSSAGSDIQHSPADTTHTSTHGSPPDPPSTQSPPAVGPAQVVQELRVGVTEQSATLMSAAAGAEVPSACGLPRQHLVDGKTTEGGPGHGRVDAAKAVFADFAHQGRAQVLVPYTCTSPRGVRAFLLLINEKGTVIGMLDLATVGKKEDHYAVTGFIGILPRSAEVAWDSYRGSPGSDRRHHRATVTYSHGKLRLRDLVVTYTPDAVLGDLLEALERRERLSLRDPDVISRTLWRELARHGQDPAPEDTCNSTGIRAQCTYMSTATTAGNARVITMIAMVKDSTDAYGWRITQQTAWVD